MIPLASPSRPPSTRARRRLERLGEPPLHVALEGFAIDCDRQPIAHCQGAAGAVEQAIRKHDGLTDAAPNMKMEFANQRDAHDPDPRDASRYAARAGTDFGHGMVSDQVVRPLDWRTNSNCRHSNAIQAHKKVPND